MPEWTRWFSKKGSAQKSAAPLIALTQPGDAHWGGRDQASLVRDGYLRNAVAYRCVRLIAEAAASVPLVSEHERVAALLRRPAPDVPGAAFLESVYADLQLSGNAFVEAVSLEAEDAPAALYPVRSAGVRPLTDARGWIEGFAVRGQRGERMLRRDAQGWLPMLQIKLYHPTDNALGLAPLGPARRALDLHNASADWAKALIDNSAKPSGALVFTQSGRLPPDQFDRIKEELESLYSGAGNAGRPMLLEGGLDWRPMSLSPADMDFLNARHAAAREIALALGVPPLLLGLPGDNTYTNYREANLAFWRMTILPLVEKMAAALSVWFDLPFGGDVDVRCDIERVPALSAERDALWARLEGASFATLTEKRRIAGLEP
jgi:HK97 family phage portal protein